ncbi:hypothetical protein J6590_023120 [Homalodisca vitripennis]|nr:hypothetical protein J6590_023120 [Homalodisca vitripennis]
MLHSLDKKEEQNRASLKRIIDITIFCGENEIPVRGHWATEGRKPFRKGGQLSSVARVQIKLTVGKCTGKSLLIRSSAALDFTDRGIVILPIGQQRNIYTHLERCITSKLRTAKVVVSTLPHRHDLPAQHPINRETSLINAYIEELCVRQSGVEVVDFNRIGRGAFTNHGMHLKPQCKRLLAELLMECMGGFCRAVTSRPPPLKSCRPSLPRTDHLSKKSVACKTPAAVELPTLSFETFADVVKLNNNKSGYNQKNSLILVTSNVT